MIIPIELRFKADKDSKSAFRTDKKIKSHDVNTVEFHISIDGLELADNHTAKILSIFHSSNSQVNVDCEIVEGKIIYKPDTNLISRYEHVTNYVYVYHNNQSLDVCEFIYIVDLSKIDETSLEVKEVYDQSYADLLADFEQALADYKLTLPQADSVRADIDAILNQFSEDSRAKLSQYDTDVQQVIADNQAAFDLAESSRVQAEGQRESAESIRKANESDRVQDEIERENNEEARELSEGERKANEESRVLAEDERENAEAQRKIDHANRSAELDGKADKVVIENLIENGDFSDGTNGWNPHGATIAVEDNKGLKVTNNGNFSYAQMYGYLDLEPQNKYYFRTKFEVGNKDTNAGPLDWFNGGVKNSEGLYELVKENTSEETSRVQLKFSDSSTLGDYYYIKNIQFINLTETFGAGNEPTREEMDELIKVTGYIDGEYALNNREMLIWILALIRRNKDAIIALGGA